MPFIGSTGGFGYGRWQQLDSMGKVVWVTHISTNMTVYPSAPPEVGDPYMKHQTICCDSKNNIIFSFPYNTTTSTFIDQVSDKVQMSTLYTLAPANSGAITTYSIGIVKYDTNGKILWNTIVGKHIDGLDCNAYSENMVIDSKDNIYMVGYFFSSISLYNADGYGQTFSGLTISTGGVGNTVATSYLAKYNSNGIVEWATIIDKSVGPIYSGGLTIDNNDNVYISGQYSGNGPLVYDASGLAYYKSINIINGTSGKNAYFIKYNSNGKSQWTNILTGNIANEYGPRVAYTNNNIYAVGVYDSGGTINLYNASSNGAVQTIAGVTLPGTLSGLRLAYLVNYTSAGAVQWATCVDGPLDDISYDITADSMGNAYWCGTLLGSGATYNFNDASGNTQSNSAISSITTPCTFFTKYNSNGKVQWTTGISTLAGGTPIINKLFCDKANNVYLCGAYNRTTGGARLGLLDADGVSQSNSKISLDGFTTINATNSFLIKYNTNGKVLWATNIGAPSALSNYQGLAVTSDNTNNIYMSGFYSNNAPLCNTRFYLRDYSNYVQTSSLVSLPGTASKFYNYLVKYR